MTRRIAVSRLYIISDENHTAPQSSLEVVEQCDNIPYCKLKSCYIAEAHRNQVVDIDNEMNVLGHFPLTEEIAMTEWLGGTLAVKGGKGRLYPTVLSPSELCTDDGCGNGHVKRF